MILNDTQSLGGAEGSQSGAASAKIQEELNRFLILLVTQLKNQDPLDPMDANEFTSQLVSFANVEQQIHQNANLEELIKLQQSSQIAAIVNYIGTRVEAETKHTVLEDGAAEFTYSMDENAGDVTINIKDSSGTTVFVGDGETGAGKHSFVWDGLGFAGMPQREGTYTVSVTALDSGDRSELGFDTLMIGTGARPLRPPIGGAHLPGVFGLHTPSTTPSRSGPPPTPGPETRWWWAAGMSGWKRPRHFTAGDGR